MDLLYQSSLEKPLEPSSILPVDLAPQRVKDGGHAMWNAKSTRQEGLGSALGTLIDLGFGEFSNNDQVCQSPGRRDLSFSYYSPDGVTLQSLHHLHFP